MILDGYSAFFGKLTDRLEEVGIELKKEYYIDHLCYRTATIDDYKEKKNELLQISEKCLENIVNGRPISKFILKSPIILGKSEVCLIELPSPKEGISYKNGFEHFEVVIGNDFDKFRENYKNVLTGEDFRNELNPEVYITFPEGTVKFHKTPLAKVVELEGNSFVTV